MQPTPIVRPTWLSLHRRTLLGLVAMTGIGAAGFAYLDRKPRPATTIVQPVPAVVTIAAPAAPAGNLTVQPPAREPAPEHEPLVPRPEPRLLAPYLDVACVLVDPGSETPPIDPCEHGDGLPAISADGTRIVVALYPGDGGRGYTNMWLRTIDVKTSKVVREDKLVTPDDLDADGNATDTTHALVAKRIAAAHKRLAGYRTLIVLPQHDVDMRPQSGMHYENALNDGLFRILDNDANAILVQERFDAVREYGAPKVVDPDADPGCHPTQTSGIEAFWDPATRVVLAQVTYTGGPCYCDGATHHYVRVAP